MNEILYIVSYKYTEDSHFRYKTFEKFEDAFDYYEFLDKNLSLSSLTLKVCMAYSEELYQKCGN